MAMSATSLKLSPQLKQRIVTLVEGTGRTAHAFMVEAIEQATQSEELRRRFGAEADAAERETMKTGRAYDAAEVFNYLEARSRGASARKPRQKAWRKSA
jgi:predicted transcriptional regulator